MTTPAIQPENVQDFVNDTLRDLGKPKFTDISSVLQNHVFMKHLARQNRVVLESGSGVQFNVLVNQSNAARNVGLAQSDNVNQVDGMVQANVPWRNTQTSYMIIEQLMAMNREPARIVDYVKQQRIMALISLAELMEQNFWGAPASTDGLTPYGLPYWVVKNGTLGFTGTTLTGYTTVAALSPTTYTQWVNWAAPYTAVSRDDFIRSARQGATKTLFMPSVDGIPSPNTGDEYGFYCNYSVYQPLEESLENQNDNLGKDVASMDGQVHFRRTPVVWVPWLDRDTTNPFYGVNWGWMKLYILRGWWLKETDIPYTPGQHTVASHFLDCTYQVVSKNRRCHMVLSNGTTYPS
jgi:hypothetical protein